MRSHANRTLWRLTGSIANVLPRSVHIWIAIIILFRCRHSSRYRDHRRKKKRLVYSDHYCLFLELVLNFALEFLVLMSWGGKGRRAKADSSASIIEKASKMIASRESWRSDKSWLWRWCANNNKSISPGFMLTKFPSLRAKAMIKGTKREARAKYLHFVCGFEWYSYQVEWCLLAKARSTFFFQNFSELFDKPDIDSHEWYRDSSLRIISARSLLKLLSLPLGFLLRIFNGDKIDCDKPRFRFILLALHNGSTWRKFSTLNEE